jgi:hypothetical protein
MVSWHRVWAERATFTRALLVVGSCGPGTWGCSSSDAESSKAASVQCSDFEARYCAKVMECAQATDRSDFEETCEFSWRVYLPCDDVAYAANVQDCLSGIDATACSSVEPGQFPSLPAECKSAFGRQ